jgi:hypothetical protein
VRPFFGDFATPPPAELGDVASTDGGCGSILTNGIATPSFAPWLPSSTVDSADWNQMTTTTKNLN